MSPRPRPSAEAGVVYVEFLLAFLPIFMLFLGIVQLSLLHAGRLIVQQAAREGVRAAAVVLPDDPARYDGAPQHELIPEHDGVDTADPEAEKHSLLDQLGVEAPVALPDPPWDPPHPGPRMATIQRAVYFRLSSLAPTLSQLPALLGAKRQVAEAIDDGQFTRALVGTLLYGAAVTAVSFPVEPGGEEVYDNSVEGARLLHLRVTYLFRCVVPLAASLLCDRLGGLGVDWQRQELAPSPGDPLLQGDLERIPSRTGLRLLALSPQRFRVLREEASFPYQGADYAYPEPDDDGEGD